VAAVYFTRAQGGLEGGEPLRYSPERRTFEPAAWPAAVAAARDQALAEGAEGRPPRGGRFGPLHLLTDGTPIGLMPAPRFDRRPGMAAGGGQGSGPGPGPGPGFGAGLGRSPSEPSRRGPAPPSFSVMARRRICCLRPGCPGSGLPAPRAALPRGRSPLDPACAAINRRRSLTSAARDRGRRSSAGLLEPLRGRERGGLGARKPFEARARRGRTAGATWFPGPDALRREREGGGLCSFRSPPRRVGRGAGGGRRRRNLP
jgi:hypothetical protein